MKRKREYGKDGNNGTDGKKTLGAFPFVPLFPSFPYSLLIGSPITQQ
jgi:hypothetical protein